jgi:hypothetical protein
MRKLARKNIVKVMLSVMLSACPSWLFAQVAHYGLVYDANHLLAYAVAAMLIGIFVLLFYNRLFTFREQLENRGGLSQNARMALVLQSSNLRLWLYDPSSRHYTVLSETGVPIAEYNPVEFSRLYDRDDFESLRSAVFDICDGKRLSASLKLCGCVEDDGLQRRYEINVSIASRNVKGRVRRVLGIQHDVTDEYLKEQQVNQLLMRFQTVFSSSLMDMVYYDAGGVLRNINDKACQTFRIPNSSYVLDGTIERGCSVRISREGEQIFEGALASLKRFKDDVKEVGCDFECGISIVNFNDIREGDVLETYTEVEVKAKL